MFNNLHTNVMYIFNYIMYSYVACYININIKPTI